MLHQRSVFSKVALTVTAQRQFFGARIGWLPSLVGAGSVHGAKDASCEHWLGEVTQMRRLKKKGVCTVETLEQPLFMDLPGPLRAENTPARQANEPQWQPPCQK